MKINFQKNKHKMRSIVLLALFVFCASVILTAESVEKGARIHGFVTEEIRYPYTVERYAKPLDINRMMAKGSIDHQSPEQVAARHVSAMLTSDYQSWISLWDKEERKKVMAKHALEGKGEHFWTSLWANTFSEYEQFHLTRYVASRNFVIIELRASNAGGDVFTVDIPLIKIRKLGADHYYITDMMKNDPVYESWRVTGSKVMREVK